MMEKPFAATLEDADRMLAAIEKAKVKVQVAHVARPHPVTRQVRDLLKAALRHRPDRIVLGEIRSGEAFELLQLLNTGHSGTISTIHASSAKQGLSRFASCVLQSGVEIPYRAIKSNIADSLNVVVQIERRPGRRFISEVLEINNYDPDADLFDFCAIYVAPREPA